jgi:hypothetical protein
MGAPYIYDINRLRVNMLYLISGSAYQKLSWTVDYRAIFLYSSQTVRTLDYTHVKQTTCLVILNRPLCWLCKVLFIGSSCQIFDCNLCDSVQA